MEELRAHAEGDSGQRDTRRQDLDALHRQELADQRQLEELQLEELQRQGDQDTPPREQQQQPTQGPPQPPGAEGGVTPASRVVPPTVGVQQGRSNRQKEILQFMGRHRLQMREEAAQRRRQRSHQEGPPHQDP